ncbi:MAG: DUF502 domain-containing protein [Candidatus Omnitrophica bacterium]|nr:DUF502 domain-containing protein [Candidatus Omnitrophota bacterium]
MSRVKRYFFTGFFIILPVFITAYVLYAIFIFIDGIWGKIINFYLRRHLGFAIPGLGFILGMLTILVVGFIATNLLGKRLFNFFEHIFRKFPMIKLIYDPAKQIVNSFTSRENPAFKKVVLVEYPSKGIWSIGFLTNEGFKEAQEKTGEELLHVFIATTPSPFTGFLVLFPKRDVKILDISVEGGIKLIVSGGIVRPER